MKKIYLLIAIFSVIFIFNSCSDDEQQAIEIINTDISVSTMTEFIVYNDLNDLETKLNQVLTYDYGNALESELNIIREFNNDYTRVVVSINFKSEFTNKYNDQNPSNNIVVIDLQESQIVSYEGDEGNTEFNLGVGSWDTCDITFSFFGHTNDLGVEEQELAFLEAGQKWTNEIPGLEFTNVGPNNTNALFRIDFATTLQHPPCPLNFSSNGTIAHAFWPTHEPYESEFWGDIYFNDNKTFTNGNTSVTQYDFITIAVHEIGHSLGIAHNDNLEDNSVMFPSYSEGNIKRNLAQDDIDAINELYFNNCSGNAFSSISLSNNIDFGQVQINTNSTIETLTVSNTGNSSFDITNISSSNNAFTILNGQSTSVSPNSSVDFDIQFSPNNEQTYNGVITVDNTADNANSSNSSIQVTGIGVNNNSSAISLSGNLNFGDVEVGQSDTRTFTISNTGNQSFNVSSISFPSGVYSANWNSGAINAGGSQNITVTFQPTNVQSYNGTVTVNHSADSGNNTISISGNGTNNNQNVNLSYNDHLVKDGNGGGVGNSNGIAEAGEEIDLDVQLINTGNITATNVSATLTTNDSDINITDDFEAWNDIPAGATEWEADFDFDIDPNCPTKTVTFNLQITSDQGTWNDTFTINVQGSSGGNPQVDVGNNTPRDNCSDTGSSNNYKLDLNTIYYKQNWNIDNIIGYGSDGNRGMWYRFETTNSGSYNIGVSFNGNAGFQLFSSCSSSSPIITSNSSSGTAETAQVNLSANTEYFIRFYDINDINPVNFVITIENN